MTNVRRARLDRILAEYEQAELAIGDGLGHRAGGMTAAQFRQYYESRSHQPCTDDVCKAYWFREYLELWGAYDVRQRELPRLFTCDRAREFLDILQPRVLMAPRVVTPALTHKLSERAEAVAEKVKPKTCGRDGVDVDGDGLCFVWEDDLAVYHPSAKTCGGMCEEPTDALALDDRKCQLCANGKLLANDAADATPCTTDKTRACYLCSRGSCKNECGASEVKQSVKTEKSDESKLAALVKKVESLLEKMPVQVDAKLTYALNASKEIGEQCCELCSVGKPLLSRYEKVTGSSKVDLAIRVGIKGWSGTTLGIIPATNNLRYQAKWRLGPYATVSGSVGNEYSSMTTSCEDQTCDVAGVTGSLGANLEAGGEAQIGIAKFDGRKCGGSAKDRLAIDGCFNTLTGAKGALWATGGGSLSVDVTELKCEKDAKCDVRFNKLGGKIFYTADVDLPFFVYTIEGTLAEGTLWEGAKVKCQ